MVVLGRELEILVHLKISNREHTYDENQFIIVYRSFTFCINTTAQQLRIMDHTAEHNYDVGDTYDKKAQKVNLRVEKAQAKF